MTNAVFWGLLGLALLAPLPLGSNHPWSWFLLATGVGVLLVLWSLGRLLAPSAAIFCPTSVRVALCLFAGVCAWVLVQWIPWTPSAWHHPLWADAARALGRELPGRISLNPEQTLTALVRLLSYGGVFWLSLQLCRNPARARNGIRIFVWAGVCYALYGLFALFSGSDQILWFGERLELSHVTSTFVNRNSYATLAGLTLVCVVTLFLDGLGGVLRKEGASRAAARRVLTQLLGPGAPLAVAALVIGTALLLTASRAGTLSTAFGLAVLLLALLRTRSLPAKPLAAIATSLVMVGIAVFSLSGDQLTRRLGDVDVQTSERIAVYGIVVRAIGDAPLLGHGYGTFADVFPLYRDERIPARDSFLRAHSTYLENALELGVPAFTTLCAAIGICAAVCFVGIRKRGRDCAYPAIGLAATAIVAVHSAVDFPLQIPAVSVSYAFVLGLACAQSLPIRDP